MKTETVESLMVEAFAVNAEVAGMVADNQQSVANGWSMGYVDKAFDDCAQKLKEIAQKMREVEK